jgi:hypothetical protein
MALPDPGALHDPLVRGFDHLFEISVGQQTRGYVGAESGNFCPHKIRQMGSPEGKKINVILYAVLPWS